MAIMLNVRSNVYENIFFSASQPPDSSTILQIAGIAGPNTGFPTHFPLVLPGGPWRVSDAPCMESWAEYLAA